MGLAISTHYLVDMMEHDAEGAGWIRSKLDAVNGLLVAAGHPPHVEPEVRGAAVARPHVGSFPYSFLQYLRRAFARVREELEVTPVAEGEDPGEDPAIEDAGTLFDTHLLVHSDAEGFYVPVEFDEVIFDHDERVPGGMLGSSHRLMAELVEVAPAIGITLDGEALGDGEAKQLADEREGGSPYWRERLVWLTLFEAARVSLANKTMIVFT